MRKRKWVLLGIVILLYGITWVGGWRSHSLTLNADAERRYRDRQHHNEVAYNDLLQRGEELPIYASVHPKGPSAGVNWCIPVLPGVLIADSYYSVGPLDAKGGLKIVLWYGFGSTELAWFGWIV